MGDDHVVVKKYAPSRRRSISFFVLTILISMSLALWMHSHQAYAQDVVVGVNLVNAPDKLLPSEQNAILDTMQAAGVKVIRTGIALDDKGVDFAEHIYARGMKIEWLVSLTYHHGTQWPSSGAYPALSLTDPDRFRADFAPMLAKLEEKGMGIYGF